MNFSVCLGKNFIGIFIMDSTQEEGESGTNLLDGKVAGTSGPHRYSKEELLDIKERPHSRQRPSCLLDKYDSDGVWDPEKWHASLYPNSGRSSPVVDPLKKDLESDRTSLKRRITDPRERLKEEELDVVLSPQRRSFGGGCHVTAIAGSRRAGSPLENKENENLRILGGRRIGSGRIVSVRGFERDPRNVEKDVRDAREGRERDYKDKRFRREYGDSKRVFGERRRNDSYTEEEPEWYSAGPTSQSETIELIGFDDKILEEDPKGRKRTRRRTTSLKEAFECNGGVAEVDEVEPCVPQEPAADQEVPQEVVLPEPAPGEFDFNEFFNLDKSVPGLASRSQENHLSHGDIPNNHLHRNILQELLGPPLTRPISSNVLTGLMGALDPAASLLAQRAQGSHVSQAFPGRASSAEYMRPRVSPPIGFPSGPQQLIGDHYQSMRKPMSPVNAQISNLELQQAALDGLLLTHDMSVNAANFYQPGFGKMQMDQGRDGYRGNRPQRMNKSPVMNHRGNASPACITSMLSPSFTPTSVIRKMYESREKSKDETSISRSMTSDGKDEDGIVSGSIANSGQSSSPAAGNKYSAPQGSVCSTPLAQNNRYTKDQDFRPKSTGRKTPTMGSPVPGAPFLRPVHQVPVAPHVPLVRPPQLHPGLVQRMLAQGIHPQQLPPLLQTGMLPPGLDLSHLQGLSAPIIGQPFYQLPTPGHPLMNPRSATSLQLAVMQQQHLQRAGSGSHNAHPSRSGLPLMQSQMEPRHRSTSPVGLSKWFGSDVLQQPLPSMPAKVITVDELEYRQ
ncbi:eukaryotic translation initiation factor 4E transporter isoform X7 [Pleurodeles waltl]|uniref:eukaryotic translation initiation factor 4E transporter isoform X7 n=1 Tax=Pleurodeles waltl TaxID=8319 RepID=UPI00370957AF